MGKWALCSLVLAVMHVLVVYMRHVGECKSCAGTHWDLLVWGDSGMKHADMLHVDMRQ